MTRIQRFLAGIGAFLAIVLGAFISGRREGAQKVKAKAKSADFERAATIEEKADEARNHNGADPVERLRDHNQLRD